ncbi:MAG TPA: prolipoprotein diacylglyceryl transferase [Longimicrobiaceae bacterium]|nr:prolipoprotein diacylglyceryl transferase [Longimicrobiaceae bacterium]
MFPVLFRIGGLEITSFGVMMALAFLSAGWLLSVELRRKGEDPETAWDVVWYAAIGGILGAKIYYLFLYWPETRADPWRAITSRAGLVWYGGFILAALLIWVRLRARKLPVLRFGDAIAPALALGYAVGRIGCLLVGDDYGGPTNLPWGIAFPKGAPPSTAFNLRQFGVRVPAGIPDEQVMTVHPTQIYEVLLTLVILAILWRLRTRIHTAGVLWFSYMAMAGVERYVVEIFRAKDDRFFGALTMAQIISLLVSAFGVAMILKLRAGAPAGAENPTAPPAHASA